LPAGSETARPGRVHPGSARPREPAACSFLGVFTPLDRRLLKSQGLEHGGRTALEIRESGPGPVAGLACLLIALAAERHPFAIAEHVAGANRLLWIGRLDGAALVQAPGPRRPVRTNQALLACDRLLECECGVDRAYAVIVRGRLELVARLGAHALAFLDI